MPLLIRPNRLLFPVRIVTPTLALFAMMGAASCVATTTADASPDCYDVVLASVQQCLPPATANGVLAMGGATCSYEGGDTITFASPQVSGVSSFTVTAPDGSVCMRYQSNPGGGFDLETADGTTTSSSTGNITCPGGATYRGSTLAGSVSAYGTGLATFSLLTAEKPLQVFNCSN